MRILILIISLFLTACASSNVSREAADNVDVGYHNAKNGIANAGNGDIADSYQNSSQTTKGVLLGGTAGAVAGGFTSGVGVFPGLAMGAILGGAYGAYIDSNTSSVDKLENRGVKTIVLGDQVMVVIQSNRLFDEMTANIKPTAYKTLDGVAQFINRYPSMSVRIAAFTDDDNSERVNLALSKEQAESVERYLWRAGVNSRLLTAVGMGGSDIVSPASTGWNVGYNYRVEITFEKLPA